MSENKVEFQVNKDLLVEREKCNFNIEEVTFIIDGGQKNTMQRRKIEDIAFSDRAMFDKIPEECMSIPDRYENAVRKSVLYTKIVKDRLLDFTDMESLGISPALRRTGDAFFKEVSPCITNIGLFVPAIISQGTPEQQAHWLPRALDMQIIGTYAQTELGHGTFIRGLETTATYDPRSEEFVLHSPTLTSYKWWAGGLGKTANYCLLIAQLYTKGECHGVHHFIVQIRDEETHEPLPGIKVGDIGPKMGFSTADNGYLGFNSYRIPRSHMLMKNAQVLKDGTYVKVARHGKFSYSTMVFVRVVLVSDTAFHLSKAVTIAIRYSAVRRQSEPRPGDPEPQILDYMTQQHKLFICIATVHALQLTGDWLWKTYTSVLDEMQKGNVDSLPELHALSCCLKAISTADSATLIEQCRLACGGHGYMLSSNLPFLYSSVTAARTYEGENTVLLLQTARLLIKAWDRAELGQAVTPIVAYLNDAVKGTTLSWDSSLDGMIRAFYVVAARKIASCARSIKKRMKSGGTFEDAWELTTVQLIGAAEAHCRAVICNTYKNEVTRLTQTSSPSVRTVMEQLTTLYLLYWTLERTGDLLRFTSISEEDILQVQQRYEELLSLIRPNAVGLVDAFDLKDEILNSTLGAYDGRVYERLMEEALKSPLNQESVNQSFHKYLKPLMQGKL